MDLALSLVSGLDDEALGMLFSRAFAIVLHNDSGFSSWFNATHG